MVSATSKADEAFKLFQSIKKQVKEAQQKLGRMDNEKSIPCSVPMKTPVATNNPSLISECQNTIEKQRIYFESQLEQARKDIQSLKLGQEMKSPAIIQHEWPVDESVMENVHPIQQENVVPVQHERQREVKKITNKQHMAFQGTLCFEEPIQFSSAMKNELSGTMLFEEHPTEFSDLNKLVSSLQAAIQVRQQLQYKSNETTGSIDQSLSGMEDTLSDIENVLSYSDHSEIRLLNRTRTGDFNGERKFQDDMDKSVRLNMGNSLHDKSVTDAWQEQRSNIAKTPRTITKRIEFSNTSIEFQEYRKQLEALDVTTPEKSFAMQCLEAQSAAISNAIQKRNET